MFSPTSSPMRLITAARSSWWLARRVTGCRGRSLTGCGNGRHVDVRSGHRERCFMTRYQTAQLLAGVSAVGFVLAAGLHTSEYRWVVLRAQQGFSGLAPFVATLWLTFAAALVILGLIVTLVAFGRVTPGGAILARSEEHTSELQSRGHLVCRLLLEKKKNNNKKINTMTTDP